MLTSRISQVVTGVSGNTQCRRHLWQYVCQAFNRVDVHRLKVCDEISCNFQGQTSDN